MFNSWVIMQGFGLGLSMIIPIGAQNAFVINQGINRQHHLTTATICFVCDFILISLGVFGGGAILAKNELVLNAVTLGGIAFLLFYGYQSVASALRHHKGAESSSQGIKRGRRAVILGALAVTLFNPHVYLDTVVVLGSIGGQFAVDERLAFALGTLLASLFWFFGLSLGAAKLSPWLSQPKTRCLIDVLVAVMMFYIAYTLSNGLYARLIA